MSRAARRAHLQPGGVKITERKTARPSAPVLTVEAPEVPEVTDLDCVFQSRWRELLPPYAAVTNDDQDGPFGRAVSSLFFRGGRLADHGITVKPGVDPRKVMRYLQATLVDFGPSHEHKIGGIAHMLKKWCTILPKTKKD